MKHLTYYLKFIINYKQASKYCDVRDFNDDAFGLLKLKDTLNNKSVESGKLSHGLSVNSGHVTSKDYLLCEPIEMNDNN